MINLRPLRWPDDRAALGALDTSFTTDRVYQVVASDLSFRLEEAPIAPPLRKAYGLAEHADTSKPRLPSHLHPEAWKQKRPARCEQAVSLA